MLLQRFYKWLDKHVLPWPVRFLTNPLVIIFTFALLGPMIGFASMVALVLVLNSYTNVTSVGVSSIVLRKQLLSEEAQEARMQDMYEKVKADFTELKQMHEAQAAELAELKSLHKEFHQQHVSLLEILGRFIGEEELHG